MMVVKRKLADFSWREFTIYTVQEAHEKGISFLHWRDAEVGDVGKWFVSDDGWVGECITVQRYLRKHRTPAHPDEYDIIIRLSVGRAFNNKWGKLVFMEPGNMYPRKEMRKKKIIARVVAQYLIKGQKVDMEQLGMIWRPNSGQWRARNVHKLLCTERMKDMVKEEVVKQLGGTGWSVKSVLKRYNFLYTKSREKEPHFAKDILDKVAGILDMEPDKVVNSTRTSFSMGGMQMGQLLPPDADEMEALAESQRTKQLNP